MKLKRAAELNKGIDELEGSSQGVYLVVGTAFHVIYDIDVGWFICEHYTNHHHRWLFRHDFNRLEFPTRAQALDALEMAMEIDPL